MTEAPKIRDRWLVGHSRLASDRALEHSLDQSTAKRKIDVRFVKHCGPSLADA